MSAPARSTPGRPGPDDAADPAADPGTGLASAHSTRGRAAGWGLGVGLLLVVAAYAVPTLTGWSVATHSTDYPDAVAPLHSRLEAKVGPGTLPALLLAGLALWGGARWAATLGWRRLLLVSYAGSLAWMLSLALVDGTEGLTRVLGNPYEYLLEARATTDIPAMLAEFTARIPYAAEDNYVTHIAGHPPGALLFFVVLVRIGLGGDLAAALVVTALAATIAVAVLDTLRTLGAERFARRAAPLLVLGPAAVWLAVSADAVFAAVAAWGLACLARAAVAARAGATRWWGWAALAGLLLGSAVMTSYGLPLLGTIALAVLAAAGAWRPMPVAAAAALGVVLAFAVFGYELWTAYPVLRERYWDGLAADRPFAYWAWGNLAALLLAAGPLLAAGLAAAGAELRARGGSRLGAGVRDLVRPSGADGTRTVLLLAGAAAASIAIADLSRMSKAEVERIWLPFVPWLLVATALLPARWRRAGLAIQVGAALLAQHLLYTSW